MGLQKYRADKAGERQKNGGVPYYSEWVGGQSLALIHDCTIEGLDLPPRTVYVRGEADTWFSIPAACRYKGKTITGYIRADDNGEFVFRAHSDQKI